METSAQEECGIPVVPLWGTDLFQGYQGISMHFPPSPWAAAKLLAWPSSTADPVSSNPYTEESEAVSGTWDHLLAFPEPLLLMTRVSWKRYSRLWLLSVLTFSFYSSPSLGDVIHSTVFNATYRVTTPTFISASYLSSEFRLTCLTTYRHRHLDICQSLQNCHI